MSDVLNPTGLVQKDDESDLAFRMRKRKALNEYKRNPPKKEDDPPKKIEEDRRSTVERAYNKSAEYLEEMGE